MDGLGQYLRQNIDEAKNVSRFLSYMKEHFQIGFQLFASPLHLAMFVESFKDTNKFPSTLTEAYIKSLSIALKREIIRQNLGAAGCSNIQLFDHSSLRECNEDLAGTITNISKLAFDSLSAYDSDIFLYGKRLKTSQKEFSMTELQSYFPSGNTYGLLFPHYHKTEHGAMFRNYYFPHFIFQEFWAAFHVTVANINLSDFEEYILRHPNILYFVCGMYSSNNTMLHQVFEKLLQTEMWPHTLDYYTTCGSESGHSSQSLADIYLKLHGTALNLGHLYFSSSYKVQVKSFLDSIHLKMKHLTFTQHSPSLSLYMANRIDIFPNLEMISIRILVTELGDVKYPSDFIGNLRLVFSRQTSLSKLKWVLPLRVLIDDNFFSCLNGIFDIEIVQMEVSILGSIVQLPKSYESCCSHVDNKDLSHVVKLTPDMFITALVKFENYFRKLTLMRILFYTPVLYLECQQVHALFEALYNSFFYNDLQIFEMIDACFKIIVSDLHSTGTKMPVVRNHSSDEGYSLSIISGLILRKHGKFYSCGNRQLYTYFPNIDCF